MLLILLHTWPHYKAKPLSICNAVIKMNITAIHTSQVHLFFNILPLHFNTTGLSSNAEHYVCHAIWGAALTTGPQAILSNASLNSWSLTEWPPLRGLCGYQAEENLMVQGHGCIVDVLRPQSTAHGMIQHCGLQYRAGTVMQNHNIFYSCPWHLHWTTS
jgi:hypothetical protein